MQEVSMVGGYMEDLKTHKTAKIRWWRVGTSPGQYG